MKNLRFKRKYFRMIQSGKKTLECRLNYDSIKKISKGDRVGFFWEQEYVDVEITDVRVYGNFSEMLNAENVDALVPGMSYCEALQEYRRIYPDWKVKKFGGITVFEFE